MDILFPDYGFCGNGKRTEWQVDIKSFPSIAEAVAYNKQGTKVEIKYFNLKTGKIIFFDTIPLNCIVYLFFKFI